MPAAAVPILDGHNDVLLELELAERRGAPWSFVQGRPDGHVDLPRARAGGWAGGFFACFVPERLDGGDSLASQRCVADDGSWEVPPDPPVDLAHARDVALAMAGRLLRLAGDSGGAVRVVRAAAEIESCLADGAIAAILHLEGAEPLAPDLSDLDVWHAAGLRSIGPVWSRPNAFGHGVPFRFPGDPDTGPGLTDAGRALVRACNERRILIDLAHLNARGFWDVAELSEAPLVASHTAAHALSPTARNLTDEQIDAIGQSGGLVGVILNVWDLRADGAEDADTPLSRFAEHAGHVAARIGAEHVALGSDFDGATPPRAAGDVSRAGAVLDALREAGWSEDDVRAFAHGNWLRVLRETWGA